MQILKLRKNVAARQNNNSHMVLKVILCYYIRCCCTGWAVALNHLGCWLLVNVMIQKHCVARYKCLPASNFTLVNERMGWSGHRRRCPVPSACCCCGCRHRHCLAHSASVLLCYMLPYYLCSLSSSMFFYLKTYIVKRTLANICKLWYALCAVCVCVRSHSFAFSLQINGTYCIQCKNINISFVVWLYLRSQFRSWTERWFRSLDTETTLKIAGCIRLIMPVSPMWIYNNVHQSVQCFGTITIWPLKWFCV